MRALDSQVPGRVRAAEFHDETADGGGLVCRRSPRGAKPDLRFRALQTTWLARPLERFCRSARLVYQSFPAGCRSRLDHLTDTFP